MAYQIDRYNRTILTTVQDGTLDNTTDLKFIGKNYSGYGEVQNENFLFLLENFSGIEEPQRPISGQLWYDSQNEKLKFYDGTKFRSSGPEIGPIEPTGQVEGDLWWNTSSDQLFSYNGSEYVLVGPLFSGSEDTQIISARLKDVEDVEHTVMQVQISGVTVYIISNTEFTISSSNPVTGFTVIKKGLTLTNTNTLGISGADYVYWGTAGNSLRLGGELASNYVLKGNPSFDTVVRFADVGLTVGDSNDLAVYIENGNEPVFQNQVGNSNKLKFKCNNEVGDAVIVTSIDTTGIIPGTNNTFNLGASNNRWNKAFATTFEGVATTAQYADLAEIYKADKEYEFGTVVKLGGDAEITETTNYFDTEVFGVISENPAYLMNSEAEGLPVALMGRVKVNVIGEVKKGDRLVTSNVSGCAEKMNPNLDYDPRCVVGRSLEDKYTSELGKVEAVVGVK